MIVSTRGVLSTCTWRCTDCICVIILIEEKRMNVDDLVSAVGRIISCIKVRCGVSTDLLRTEQDVQECVYSDNVESQRRRCVSWHRVIVQCNWRWQKRNCTTCKCQTDWTLISVIIGVFLLSVLFTHSYIVANLVMTKLKTRTSFCNVQYYPCKLSAVHDFVCSNSFLFLCIKRVKTFFYYWELK